MIIRRCLVEEFEFHADCDAGSCILGLPIVIFVDLPYPSSCGFVDINRGMPGIGDPAVAADDVM